MISKKLFTGGINGDDSDVLIQANEYLNASNIRFATTENGKIGEISNVEGNVLKSISVPSGSVTIGAIEDTPNKRLFWFNKNTDGIFCYDADVDQTYTVLLGSQVVGGLNFSEDIHSASIIDNLLYWTDGVNPQRRINVAAAINLNHPGTFPGVDPYILDKDSSGSVGTTHIGQSVISLIRNQPWAPATLVKEYDSSFVNNFIKNEAFEFAYRFVYRDYEISTFSPLSNLANFNLASDNYNRIKVTIPLSQKIEQDVIKIELAAKYIVGGRYFVVKTFDSGFSAHNSGTALEYYFYNDAVGIAVDDATSIKQFDPIPLKSESLEIARNRLFLGNNTDGYPTPLSTSLMAEAVEGGGGSQVVTGIWKSIQYILASNPGVTETIYMIYLSGISQSGYYRTDPESTSIPPITSIDYATLIFVGADLVAVESYIDAVYGPTSYLSANNETTIDVTGVQSTTTSGDPVFKSDSTYRLGVVFYDEAGRKCGVVTNDEIDQTTNKPKLKIITPDREFSTVAYTASINWSLSNANAVNEIPEWAKYYSIVMTKCLRTSFFMQLRADNIKWVNKDDTGAYVITNTYDPSNYGLAVDIKSIYGIGYGYSYQEGDLIKLYKTGVPTKTLGIKDTFGSYVICDNYNITQDVLYEIYTPYIQNTNEPYYERYQTFQINNPGTPTRSYSDIYGSISGDIVLLQRGPSGSNYLVEAMSPNDIQWKRWNTDAGRANYVLDTKLVEKKVNVMFSNSITLGSEINGLSTFDVLDQTQLPYELTSIQRLTLVSKIESEGTVMLAIGEQETASIYLGETQVFDNSGSSFLAKSSGVIGNVNVLRGSYGTINPESVVVYMGNVYWFDANRGAVVSYSTNGLFPVSQNKMSKYFRKIGQDVLANSLKFYGGVDPFHNEILMTAPRRSVIPEGERLLDMIISSTSYNISSTSTPAIFPVTLIEECEYTVSVPPGVEIRYNGELVNGKTFVANGTESVSITSATPTSGVMVITRIVRGRYDIYDGQGGTWAYQPGLDKWTTSYSFKPEWMTSVINRLVTFRSGLPYIHNSSTYNNFYGIQHESVLSFSHNDAGNVIKVYDSFSVEGNTPDLVHHRTEVPFLQSSDIYKSEFIVKEGVSYSSILRDRLTPGGVGSDYNLIFGDVMRGEVGKFQVMYDSNSLIRMKFCNVGFILSRGQTTTPQNIG